MHHFPRFSALSCTSLVAWIMSGLVAAQAVGQELDPQRVREAIHWGVDTLKQGQLKNGSWPSWPPGNDPTPLCTLALLNAGVEAKDAAIQKALNFIRNKGLRSTYEAALEIMVMCVAEPERDLDQIRKRAVWLVKTQNKEGDRSGMWSYPLRGEGDNSNSQFALLGLYEADRALKRYGQKSPVPNETWKLALDRWIAEQNGDGSWGYTTKGAGSGYGSMTCAGVASVIIASGRLGNPAATFEGGQVKCCGSAAQDKAAAAISNGMNWLATNFTAASHAGAPRRGQGYYYYYMYALERVGRLTAQRFIGKHDWYREGAKELLGPRLHRFRGWVGEGLGEDQEHLATSFALLFLSKGRRPVVVGKLAYGRDGKQGDWNRHPADIARLTEYVEEKWKRDLTFYVIHAERATSDDFQHAPVLYFSGRKELEFMANKELTAKIAKELREYIDRGGFIYAEACCEDSHKFHESFKSFMEEYVFPEQDAHKFHELSPDHEIWLMEEVLPKPAMYANWLWEIRKGCRTAVVYCVRPDIAKPGANVEVGVVAPSCYWELSAGFGRDGKLPMEVQADVNTALALGNNVLAYATGRKVKFKEDVQVDSKSRANNTLGRVLLEIPQLRHSGGWNAAPDALVTLQRELNQHAGVVVPTDRLEIDLLDPKLSDYHMLFMHGRNSFTFTDKQREKLREFVEKGGTILADAVCGSAPFRDAFRKEMAEIFKERKLSAIPDDHKLFTTAYGGFDLKNKVKLRLPPRERVPGQPLKPEERDTTPELEGITFEDGRYGVIFSPYDLSCALEGHENVKCPGYSRPDAARIGINVVLYSLHE
jgi:hypothetical protein